MGESIYRLCFLGFVLGEVELMMMRRRFRGWCHSSPEFESLELTFRMTRSVLLVILLKIWSCDFQS